MLALSRGRRFDPLQEGEEQMNNPQIGYSNSVIILFITKEPIASSEFPLKWESLVELKAGGADITLTRDMCGFTEFDNAPVRIVESKSGEEIE